MGNCPTVRYGDGVSWNVRAGHGCIGCFAPNFWDGYSPAYRRLGSPVPFFPSLTVDTVGAALVGGIGVVAVAHGAGMASRSKYRERVARRAAATAELVPDEPAADAPAPVEPVPVEPVAGPEIDA
jgi:hydrogenase small subunit